MQKILIFLVLISLFSCPLVKNENKETTNTIKPIYPTSSKINIPCGINLAEINDWSQELPFKDLIKIARPWNNGVATGLTFDENGWIRSIDPAIGRAELNWDSPITFAGEEFVCTFDGTGDLQVNPYAGMIETSRSPGRIEFRMDEGRSGIWSIIIASTDPVNYIRNIKIIKRVHASLDPADPWNPEFISKIVNHFSTLRFMDWQSTNNSLTSNWGERKTINYYTQSSGTSERSSSVAIEYMADLCNRTGSNGWFCIPHLATEDYIRQFATYLRDNMNPELKIYIEYSNECWNWAFNQSGYCHDQGVALNLDPDEYTAWRNYYSLRSVNMFHIFESVFSGQTGRLVRVLASQGSYYDVTGRMLDYVLDGQRTALHADVLAIAPYFGAEAHRQIGLNNLDNLFDYLNNDVNSTVWADGNDTVFQNMIVNYNMFIATNPNLKLIAYEGGQHILPLSETAPDQWQYDENKNSLFLSAQTDSRMGMLYRQYLTHWRDSGGQLFMLYSSVGDWGQYGYWGILPVLSSNSSPKYDAVINWMNENPVWW
jgi:hypothetical protein